VHVTEKTEFGHGANLEEPDSTPQVAATREHGLNEQSPQGQVFYACDQPVASSVPTPASSGPFLSPYTANIAPVAPLAIQPSPGIAAFTPYQQPLPQIAPCSFKVAMNGDQAIEGGFKEKQQAREEYKRALTAGKSVYLLEQAAPDGKSLKDMAQKYKEANRLIVFHASLGNIKAGSELEFRIPFVSIAGDNQTSASPVFGAAAPRCESPSSGTSMQLLNRGNHASAFNAPEPAYPVPISLGFPVKELTGNWKLSEGSVDPHAFLEKEVVITISPRELGIGGSIPAEAVKGAVDVCTLLEAPRFAPPLLAAQEYLFLVDRSSSMRGSRIIQAKNALRIMVKSLPDSTITSFVSNRLVL
jgi:hypothetical protein